MVNPNIVSYIKEQLGLNLSEQSIKENLRKVGWSEDVISESYNFAITNNVPPISSIETPQYQATVMQNDPTSINSPYSTLLSVLLVVSLFILTNGIFTDIKSMASTENTILLMEGLFVIPFLLVAFLLHASLKTENKRFEILSYPYFIISAWILLRLLWKVGENIWQANNALGVYVILGMVVVVLTGIIIFVQRYIKK